MKLDLTVDLIAEEAGGFTAYCPELDIYTQGDDESDALENMREAAELHLEELGSIKSMRKVLRRSVEIFANV